MLYDIISRSDTIFGFKQAKAHCDIPCGIYDPALAQIAALTVIRMIDLADELKKEHPEDDLSSHNSLTRYTSVKEEYAEKCKHEIRVIWGDYFKPEHLEKYPELNSLVHEIMQHGSKARQTVDRSEALNLLKSVNQFAQIFWETKGIKTKQAKSPYDPKEMVVYPVL